MKEHQNSCVACLSEGPGINADDPRRFPVVLMILAAIYSPVSLIKSRSWLGIDLL